MGVYSMDRHQATGVLTVPANESYYGEAGAQRILAENAQNDLAFFEGVIANDFKMAVGVHEGTILESELQALTEGTISSFFGKLKEMVKKIWAKIKGMFKNFLIKITAMLTKDNKELVNKYKKDVLKKDLSKMKYKWENPKDNNFSEIVANIQAYKSFLDTKDELSSDKYEDEKEEWLGMVVNSRSCSVSDFPKEVHSYLFEDADEVEGLNSSRLATIITDLSTSSTVLRNIKKTNDEVEKLFREKIKKLDKKEDELSKKFPEGDTKELDSLHGIQRTVTMLSEVTTMTCNAYFTAIKYKIAQERRVFVKAATYTAKKEDAMLWEACCEVSDQEIEDAIATAPTAADKEAYDAAARDGKIDPIGDIGPDNGSI